MYVHQSLNTIGVLNWIDKIVTEFFSKTYILSKKKKQKKKRENIEFSIYPPHQFSIRLITINTATKQYSTSEHPPHCQFFFDCLLWILLSQLHSFSSPFEHALVIAYATPADVIAWTYAFSLLPETCTARTVRKNKLPRVILFYLFSFQYQCYRRTHCMTIRCQTRTCCSNTSYSSIAAC